MLKTLDRYVLKEMIVPLFFSVVAIIVLFQLNFLIFLFKHFRVTELPLISVLQIVLYKTPDFLKMTLVTGTALTSALAISRLNRESELVIFQSVGISIHRAFLPIFIVGLLMSFLSFYIIEILAPQSNKAARTLLVQFVELQASPQLQSDVILKLRNGYTATFERVSRGAEGGIELNQIQLFEQPNPNELWLYTAKSGRYENGVWKIHSPFIYAIQKDQITTVKSKSDLLINEPISINDFDLLPIPDEQNLNELRDRIKKNIQNKQDATDLEVVYYSKFAIPLSCLVFGFVGPAFAVRFASRGPFVGVLMTMLGLLIYYNLFLISNHVIGGGGILPPYLAVWIPHIVFIGISFYSLITINKTQQR